VYNAAMRVWVGPLLAIVAIAAYFAVFLNIPSTRDVPWPSYALLVVALALSTLALVRAARARRGLVPAAIADLATTGLAAFFVWYCLVFSVLPELPGALAVGAPVPAVTLVDDRGTPVDVAALARDKLLLVFYRGHW
jgi:hypothetical protein